MFDLISELTFPDINACTDEQIDGMTRSAEARDIRAITALAGVMCSRDDFGGRAVWFTRAAEAGSSIAMFWMGHISMRADDFVAARTVVRGSEQCRRLGRSRHDSSASDDDGQ